MLIVPGVGCSSKFACELRDELYYVADRDLINKGNEAQWDLYLAALSLDAHFMVILIPSKHH